MPHLRPQAVLLAARHHSSTKMQLIDLIKTDHSRFFSQVKDVTFRISSEAAAIPSSTPILREDLRACHVVRTCHLLLTVGQARCAAMRDALCQVPGRGRACGWHAHTEGRRPSVPQTRGEAFKAQSTPQSPSPVPSRERQGTPR